jgi:hypothetical protein
MNICKVTVPLLFMKNLEKKYDCKRLNSVDEGRYMMELEDFQN